MTSLFRPGRTERRVVTQVDPQFPSRRSINSTAGEVVTDDYALQLSAVWGCVDILSELVSTLPVHEYRDVNGTPTSLPSSFLDDPAGDGSGFEVWARQLMVSELLRGNGYGLITSLGSDGWPRTIELIHPDRVTIHKPSYAKPAEWRLDDKPIGKWPMGPLWHLPAYNVPGTPLGMSPIEYASQTIGLGIAAQKFGSRWFGDGKIPAATLESDQAIDQATAETLKARVMDVLDGSREPLVLGAGLTFKPIQISAEESQFLETIKANADDIARFFFRRPPGEGGSVTYANVEARSLDMLTYSVAPWLTRIEKSLTRLRPRPRYVKFNADALIRVDLASRYKAHDMAIRSGWKSRDEVRELEDMAPIGDGTGGEFLWPPYATSLTEGGVDDGSSEPANASS